MRAIWTLVQRWAEHGDVFGDSDASSVKSAPEPASADDSLQEGQG
jgi:hypothetical protein